MEENILMFYFKSNLFQKEGFILYLFNENIYLILKRNIENFCEK